MIIENELLEKKWKKINDSYIKSYPGINIILTPSKNKGKVIIENSDYGKLKVIFELNKFNSIVKLEIFIINLLKNI